MHPVPSHDDNQACTLLLRDNNHTHPEPLRDHHAVTVPCATMTTQPQGHCVTTTMPAQTLVVVGPLRDDDYACPDPLCDDNEARTFLPSPSHANYANTQGRCTVTTMWAQNCCPMAATPTGAGTVSPHDDDDYMCPETLHDNHACTGPPHGNDMATEPVCNDEDMVPEPPPMMGMRVPNCATLTQALNPHATMTTQAQSLRRCHRTWVPQSSHVVTMWPQSPAP